VPVQRQKQSAADLLSKAVRAKIEDGNMKAAVRILLSEDTPAVPSEESWHQLCENHPPAFKSDAVLPEVSQASSFIVDEDDVRKAVLSFPAGSAGVLMVYVLNI